MALKKPNSSDDSDSDGETTSTSSTTTDDTGSDNTTDSDDSDDFTPEQSGTQGKSGGQAPIANKPHDEEFAVDNDHVSTPPSGATRSAAPAAADAAAAGGAVDNKPHDEEFDVEDGDHSHSPPQSNRPPQQAEASGDQAAAGQAGGSKLKSSGMMYNEHADEFEDVEDDMTSSDEEDEDETPVRKPAAAPMNSDAVQNEHFDEQHEIDGQSNMSSPQSQQSPQQGNRQPAALPAQTAAKAAASHGRMALDEDEDEDEESSSEDDDSEDEEGGGARMKNNMSADSSGVQPSASTAAPGLEYNAADYAFLNNRVSADVRDLFLHIGGYQPTTAECPARLRPFNPEFIPSVGDIDTFCKIPRPDGKADNFGLVVVDEPASDQSNPAVVVIGLSQQVRGAVPGGGTSTYVDSVEDAHARPQVIDKWIADIKALQFKKPLTTVSYSKPMPDIEQLMQVWPQQFEDALSNDVMLPPSNIELDIYQYVRVLCAVLDIPTHTNLVESLHVMFTLYLEFRENQHFRNA